MERSIIERFDCEMNIMRRQLERHKAVILRTAFMAGVSIVISIIAVGICVLK